MEPFKSCDKRLVLSVVDSGSTGTTATKAFLRSYNNMTTRPHIMVGTARSSAAMPTAVVSGIYDVPMITYRATSAKLDDMGEYPRFMRTIPTDDVRATSTQPPTITHTHTHPTYTFDPTCLIHTQAS